MWFGLDMELIPVFTLNIDSSVLKVECVYDMANVLEYWG
jgi:hypothetical protein